MDQHRQPGDLLLDYDAIMQAITGLPTHSRPPADQDAAHWLCYDAMRAMIQRAEALDTPARIWVISTEPDGVKLSILAGRLGANLVTLDTDRETCRARVSMRPGPGYGARPLSGGSELAGARARCEIEVPRQGPEPAAPARRGSGGKRRWWMAGSEAGLTFIGLAKQ